MIQMFDFSDGNGPVPAHRHPNGFGWVSNTTMVDPTVYIGPDAWVYGNARVYRYAQVSGNSQVFGNAQVFVNARVYGDARVYGNAWVYENAMVYENATVSGNAKIFGNAWVYENAMVSGNARVYGDARVYGNAILEMTPPRVSRSDGYDFIVTKCSDGEIRIIAGCRYFTFEEAYDHWTKTRSGTPLGDETFDILSFLKIRAEKVYG